MSLNRFDCRLLLLAILVAGPFTVDVIAADHSFLDNGVTAHRGNSSEQPENTIAAMRSGIAVGADWIELDIFRSADGEIVVIHDATTNRVAGKNRIVETSTYETLQKLDVATQFRQQQGQTLETCPPQKIPLLRDVLKLVMSQQKTRVSIQPKSDCVADAMAIIREMNAEKWVGFNDGSLSKMAEVKQLDSTIPVFWDRPANSNVREDIQTAKQHRFETLVLNEQGVTAEKIQLIQAAGLKVGAWTVNDRKQMEQFLAMGIDRIYTDHPRLLLKLIEAK